ncbi:MAG TPA: PHB depolymerase family esterase [Caldimonas sp.]|nr:PHB depolymerase family esterase [Caldimonas sp.]HEX2541813.1 PHB depolymerase family esterase [Caldimonas sp.]
MTFQHSLATPRFDADDINRTIQRALASAGLDTSTGSMHEVTETIRRALSSNASSAVEPSRPSSPAARSLPGRLIAGEFSNRAGTRAYKLYVPSQGPDSSPPLIVMLHGCTQSADDFSQGTQMSRLAEEHGFLVLYVEQAAGANASRCWNWFQPHDQQRDKGEPSVIAGMVREVAAAHGVDERRIFVAGLSAGAAMAVVLGETYPDIFAAVGAHSGLPFASAHDIPSAMAAMKGGRGRSGRAGLSGARGGEGSCRQAVPTIVFHGDRDHTVQHSNGAAILEQAREAYVACNTTGATLAIRTERGTAPGGRTFSRSVHTDTDGRDHLEFWTLHGAGHAWSGGHASGSYTDAQGPDASSEMVRFFLSQPRAGSA